MGIRERIRFMIDNPIPDAYFMYTNEYGQIARKYMGYPEKYTQYILGVPRGLEDPPLMHTGFWPDTTLTLGVDFYMFREHCTKEPSDCPDGLDRYGQCCYVYDGDSPEGVDVLWIGPEEKRVFKVRYADYPSK